MGVEVQLMWSFHELHGTRNRFNLTLETTIKPRRDLTVITNGATAVIL